MTDSTCPDSNCRFRNRFGYCTVTTCVFVPTKVAIREDPDLVRVVRCSDCRYWEPPTDIEADDGSTAGHCRNDYAPCQNQKTVMTWFCADGERRDEPCRWSVSGILPIGNR